MTLPKIADTKFHNCKKNSLKWKKPFKMMKAIAY